MNSKINRDIEGRRRKSVSLWAFAYAVMNDPIVPDNVYDAVIKQVDLKAYTDDLSLDLWFEENYSTQHSRWIWTHPDFEELAEMYHGLHRRAEAA